MDNKDKTEEKKAEEILISDTEEENEDKKIQHFCYMCRRSEKQAGKLMRLSGDIHICQDCLQKTFDTMGSGNFKIFDMGTIDNGNFDFSNLFANRMPNAKKVKEKKKEKKTEEKVLSLKNLPAPHKIKASLDEYVIGQE